jgi:hypothetical protein
VSRQPQPPIVSLEWPSEVLFHRSSFWYKFFVTNIVFLLGEWVLA